MVWPWRVHWANSKSSNLHVFPGFLGSARCDILLPSGFAGREYKQVTTVQRNTQSNQHGSVKTFESVLTKASGARPSPERYTAASSTFRASRGDRLEIQLEKDPQAADVVFFRRFPDDWRYVSNNAATTRLPLTVDPVSPAHNGVYLLGNSGTGRWGKNTESEIGSNGAYFHLAVRDCEADRYGWNCESWCPDCENGGICHPLTGTCICPPGYSGSTCQTACSKGKFGSRCQLECTKASLGFDLPREGSCHHLTICLPDPYGCSCAAGHTGPLCEQRCRRGSYGAGCTLSCESFCENGNCDPATGKCNSGCKRHVPCNDDGSVLDLPRLSRPPGITGVTSTSAQVVFSPWHRDTDDGSSAFPITGYRVRYRTDQDADWQEADSSDSHGGGKWEKESMGVTDQGGARVTMIR
ncbi:tyrosine-protein kinase receptor Tie-1-like [Penaeus monodon]|uniref:tyrosine-protein kinase receptor Tie-1-like n=1 Tax=Penaeus monodon TaxID=6687 RepID=UPI0018A7221D|nr:tyrosine-protein kinase receptor Tie-1-like [Penaeus monodon]